MERGEGNIVQLFPRDAQVVTIPADPEEVLRIPHEISFDESWFAELMERIASKEKRRI